MTKPFMWALMDDLGNPYFSECCVGAESDMISEAQNHNDCAEEAGDDARLSAVPLFLNQPALNWRSVTDELPVPDIITGRCRLCIVRISFFPHVGNPALAMTSIVYDNYHPRMEAPAGTPQGCWGCNEGLVTHWLYADELLETVPCQ